MVAVPFWVTLAVIGATFTIMLVLELRFPLRHAVEEKAGRVVRNLTVGALAWPVLNLAQAPLVILLAGWAGPHRVGVLNWTGLPYWLELGCAILLLDYTLWQWHWLNHRVPFLWRFHLAHHVDRDLDASTALRFHFGELAFSIAFRVLQVLAIGVDAPSMAIWETAVFVSILFHHSNIRIPIGIERALVKVVVTPRMHGIHHSDREGETNSNWSNFLSIWDYAHGTARLNVPQRDIVIGVPAYRDPADVTIGQILALPFRRQRADWRDRRGDGRRDCRRRRRQPSWSDSRRRPGSAGSHDRRSRKMSSASSTCASLTAKGRNVPRRVRGCRALSRLLAQLKSSRTALAMGLATPNA